MGFPTPNRIPNNNNVSRFLTPQHIPTNFSARSAPAAAASLVMEMDEVFDAMTASFLAT